MSIQNPFKKIQGKNFKIAVKEKAKLLFLVSFVAAGLVAADSTESYATEKYHAMRVASARYGGLAVQAVNELILLMDASASMTDLERLNAVNDFFNKKVFFKDDLTVWGAEDYWASPMEMLMIKQGDCEDYAIAKYMTLRLLGVPDERMRLFYVKAKLGGLPKGDEQAHMVLGYYAADNLSEPLILDSLVFDIRTAALRPDLKPVFSFNAKDIWDGDGPVKIGGAEKRLSKWKDVLRRSHLEGF